MIADTVHSPTADISPDQHITLQIGARLRSLREQRQMSQGDIELLSDGIIGSSTIAAYERGSRTISLPRLKRLAALYGVPIEQLLPTVQTAQQQSRPSPITGRLTIDVGALSQLTGEPFLPLLRFIELIRVQRADSHERLITLRGADAMVVAAMLGVEIDDVISRLTSLDLLITSGD